jgi:hypothetical protein
MAPVAYCIFFTRGGVNARSVRGTIDDFVCASFIGTPNLEVIWFFPSSNGACFHIPEASLGALMGQRFPEIVKLTGIWIETFQPINFHICLALLFIGITR